MRINLLPPEILERQRTRRRTVAAVIVGVIVLAAIGAFYFLQVARLGEVEEDIAAQEARNAALQAQITELADIAALEQEILGTRDLLNGLLADRILWSGVLGDISLVIPSQLWLEGLSGQVGTATAPGAEGTTTETAAFTEGQGIVGQISFTGQAFSHRVVALWLSRLEDVRGFVNPWLTSSTKIGGEQTQVADLVTFNSSVDLSEQALARRAGGDRE